MNFCSECGTKNEGFVKFCGNCGNSIETMAKQLDTQPSQPQYGQPSQPQYGYSTQPQYGSNVNIIRIQSRKDPTIAAIISLFLPGLGYAYFDEVGKGIGYFFLIIFTYFLFVGFFIHIYTIFDSYSECKKHNFRNGYTY